MTQLPFPPEKNGVVSPVTVSPRLKLIAFAPLSRRRFLGDSTEVVSVEVVTESGSSPLVSTSCKPLLPNKFVLAAGKPRPSNNIVVMAFYGGRLELFHT